MRAATGSSKAPLIVPRQRMSLAVMAHCVFLQRYLLLVPPPLSSLFLCLSAASWLIAVVIIRSGVVPQALQIALISHRDIVPQMSVWGVVLCRNVLTSCETVDWLLGQIEMCHFSSRFHVHFFRNMLVLCLKGSIQHVVVCKLHY